LALFITLLAAVLQGTIGFGFAVLSVPLLTLLHPDLTPIPQILVALPLSAGAFWRERRDLDLSGVGFIVLGRVPGSLLGAWMLTWVVERSLDLIIAAVVLAIVIAVASGVSIPLTNRNRVLAGVASGFAGTASAIGGPPIALLYRSAGSGTLRASLGAIFTIGVLVSIASLAVTGPFARSDFIYTAMLTPPTLLGFWISNRLTMHVSQRRVGQAILLVSALAAVALLARALL
jgi:hypothetical protein